MSGILTFPSIAEAQRAGFAVVDHNETGYIVRRATENGFEQALVVVKPASYPPELGGYP